jgi:DNA-binding CsgD family transcriptional regulator
MQAILVWLKQLFSSWRSVALLGSFVPQMWMYVALQHFDVSPLASIMAFYFGLASCLLVCCLLWFFYPDLRAPRWLRWASSSIVFLASLVWALPQDIGIPAAVIACALSGVGIGWCFMQWFGLYYRLSPRDGAGYMLLSFSVVGFATLLLLLLSELLLVSIMFIMAPLMLIQAAMCQSAENTLRDELGTAEPCVCGTDTAGSSYPAGNTTGRDCFAQSYKRIWPIALELALYAFVLGILRGMGAESQISSWAILLNHALRGVFPLLLMFWLAGRLLPQNVVNISQAVLLCIIIALLALVLIGDAGQGVAAALVSLARNIVLVLLSVVLLHLAHRVKRHPFVIYGAGRLIHSVCTQLGMWLALGGFSEVLNESLAGISLNVLFFIVSCIFLFLANRSVRVIGLYADSSSHVDANLRQRDAGIPLSPDVGFSAVGVEAALLSDLRERCSALAVRHGLSEREVEVMELLARGRSRSYIAERLIISENTVRWHGKHLYAKLSIHTKQELLTLIEDLEGGL